MTQLALSVMIGLLSSSPTSSSGAVNMGHSDWEKVNIRVSKGCSFQFNFGPVFIYSTGSIQMLCIMDPDIVKEIILCSSLDLGKPPYLSKDRGPLLGQGVISSSGSIWAHQRKVISPEFYPDKVKGMLGLMVEATTSMLGSWAGRINSSGGTAEITVDEDLRSLSADIISRAAFGSNYSLGKDIFSKLRALQQLMAKTVFIGIPGSRYVPTKNNFEIRRLEKEINSMILRVVGERMKAKHENDFLQKILEGARTCIETDFTSNIDIKKLIVDNCKTIYFAGHETTATTAAWSLMLLAAYPDWQARARAEVLEVCGGRIPAADDLRNLKVLTMIVQETLRLYPPAVFVTRAALEDARLKDIQVPKGLDIQIPVSLLHQSPDFWGPDAHRFNPKRFANGTGAACKAQHAYMPFGFGARVCLGQHFAMVELKVILSLILSKFSFSLSPAYCHSPAFRLVIQPEHGVKLLFRRA
uniref:Unspecific monooxygenase n=1 Tax=Opuntia streptacantha TaxID=393608 RepID=A0A7C9A0N1_OPUST